MIKEVKGDLLKLALEGHFDYIIHGCNCFNLMGAGIAKQIAEQFPLTYKKDSQTIEGNPNKLGNYTEAYIKDKKFSIINLYTQYKLGANFRLAALEIGLFKLSEILPISTRIGLPQIGAGVGGGNWEDIKKVIEKHLSDHDTTIVYYEP